MIGYASQEAKGPLYPSYLRTQTVINAFGKPVEVTTGLGMIGVDIPVVPLVAAVAAFWYFFKD